jgi:hypothetical protein
MAGGARRRDGPRQFHIPAGPDVRRDIWASAIAKETDPIADPSLCFLIILFAPNPAHKPSSYPRTRRNGRYCTTVEIFQFLLIPHGRDQRSVDLSNG